MFEKIKSGINKSVTTMNVNSSVYLETSKYKVMIENDESAIRELTNQLGEMAYKQWRNGEAGWEALGEIAARRKEKEEEIDGLKIRIKELEKEKQLILGGSNAEENKNACPKCGAACHEEAVFCGSCGNRLK